MALRHHGRPVQMLLAAVLVIFLPIIGSTTLDSAPQLSELMTRDQITILITDSGLGGLSVTAELENYLTSCYPFQRVRLVFANALPSTGLTYNAMPSLEAKASAFSAALDGFTQRYHPDLILIACNTLSVVYPETEFGRRTQIPVLGIVDIGARLIAQELEKNHNVTAIILGTPTTIGSGAYGNRLAALGVAENRVVSQACELLESEIQSDPTSEIVAAMIDMYAGEALQASHRGDSADLVVALCCTHYGYARETFGKTFDSLAGRAVTIIDPNAALAQTVMAAAPCDRFDSTATEVEVVSAATLRADDIEAIARILAARSAPTAAALRAYHHDTTLFNH